MVLEKFFDRNYLLTHKCDYVRMRTASSWHPEVGVISFDNKKWTVKDYSDCSWFVKKTYAKLLLKKEIKAISMLEGVEGVPQRPFFVDSSCLAFEFVEGTPLRDYPSDKITTEYLLECERILHDIHKKGLVHLDTGAMGNWIVKPDNRPALIDFQTAMRTTLVPPHVKGFLKAMDLRGVYKKWLTFRPQEMGEHRRKAAERFEKIRKIWLFHPKRK